MENGILHSSGSVSITTITDGLFYQLGEPTNYQLLRVWDNLNSSMKSVYNIDPNLKDLILIAAYNSNNPRNSQNAVPIPNGLFLFGSSIAFLMVLRDSHKKRKSNQGFSLSNMR